VYGWMPLLEVTVPSSTTQPLFKLCSAAPKPASLRTLGPAPPQTGRKQIWLHVSLYFGVI
jgi:hypothetical protein